MNLYNKLKNLFFMLPPEMAHDAAVTLLERTQNSGLQKWLLSGGIYEDTRLEQELWDLRFPNPVGLAAGFDKNARIPLAVENMGFGHVEIGGVTAEKQDGNSKPRLFRLRDDKALINRMGFNNDGAKRVARRLKERPLPSIPLGVNIGKSKSTPLDEAERDYEFTYNHLDDYGDYFVVNVSSPNTPGLRDLQEGDPLSRILRRLKSLGAYPLLVKVSPDLTEEAIVNLVEVCEDFNLDGIIATNTTTRRSETLESSNQDEDGGLSGKPLESRSNELIRLIARKTQLPIIGVGGIFTAEDAYEKIRNGASLVQLYTGLIYRGPKIAHDINEGIADRLEKDGFARIEEAVGANFN